MIRAENISRLYGRFEAISRISFAAGPGEVVGVLGQNGAGKSTLMNVLAGCLKPTSGEVFVNGINLNENPREAKRGLGYLPEVPPLYPEMAVREYLQFCCKIKEVHRDDLARHLDELISLCGLEEAQHQLVGQLSRGFRQRAGFAQALCGDPQVLLLDEPTAGFDPLQAVVFRKLVKKLSREKTILLSSHLLSEVQEICSRVLIIHQGRLVHDHQSGSEEHRRSYRVVIGGKAARILPSVRELKDVRRVKLMSDSGDEMTRLMVETRPGDDFAAQLFTLLSGLNTPILELVPVEDTLESLFLRVTGSAEGVNE